MESLSSTFADSESLSSFRLIATDLDGTLLLPDGTISSRTTRILQYVQSLGIKVVLVSARPPRGVRKLAQTAGIGGLAICCNGAMVYDLDQDCVVSQTVLLPDQAYQLIATLRGLWPDLCFASESGLQVTCEPQFYTLYSQAVHWMPCIDEVETFFQHSIVKLLLCHPVLFAEALHTRIEPLLVPAYSITHSSTHLLEISAAHVNKARTLATLCARFNIAAQEVMAFGDMPNDISMLKWSGYSVAVENAHPLVLACVHEITRSNQEDGVAIVLERIFL